MGVPVCGTRAPGKMTRFTSRCRSMLRKPLTLGPTREEYYSGDAETVLTAEVVDGKLMLRRRPDTHISLTPLYADTFESSLGLIRFVRGQGGQVAQLSVRQDRVYDMRSDRVLK